MIECIRVELPWRTKQNTIDTVVKLLCTHSILLPRFEGLEPPQVKPETVVFCTEKDMPAQRYLADYTKLPRTTTIVTPTIESYNTQVGNFFAGRIYLPNEAVTDKVHNQAPVTLYTVKENELLVCPYDIPSGMYMDLNYRQNAESTYYEKLRAQGIKYNRVNYYLMLFARYDIIAVRLDLKEL